MYAGCTISLSGVWKRGLTGIKALNKTTNDKKSCMTSKSVQYVLAG